MLGSPGESGSPSGSSPSPGTRVESATWITGPAPLDLQLAGHPDAADQQLPGRRPPASAGPATPVTSMSPVIVTRELFQVTSRLGRPAGTGSAGDEGQAAAGRQLHRRRAGQVGRQRLEAGQHDDAAIEPLRWRPGSDARRPRLSSGRGRSDEPTIAK